MQKTKVQTVPNWNVNIKTLRDALYVMHGKGEPAIIRPIEVPQRFEQIQRSPEDIIPKSLSDEICERELNELITPDIICGRQQAAKTKQPEEA